MIDIKNKSNSKDKFSQEKCKCPYCDEELKLSCFEPTFCEPCGISFVICEKCGQVVKKDDIQNHKCS